MKLAWLTRGSQTSRPDAGNSATNKSKMSVPSYAEKQPNLRMESYTTPKVASSNTLLSQIKSGALVTSAFQKLTGSVKSWLQPAPSTPILKQPFVLPEQAQLKKQAESYAESPFEKTLFEKALLQSGKKSNNLVVSKTWAEALVSPDPLVQESASTLLKSYLAYSVNDNLSELSAHTQMKLMIFSPHLSEGPLGRAVLYEALLKLPMTQWMEFANFLKKDFSTLPAVAQALLMKQLLQMRKDLKLDKKDELTPEDLAFKRLVKQLVIKFYCEKPELKDTEFAQHEKIRLGFLKIRPIEETYREQLEEIEKKYRLKLRQLKKRRSQNVAESDEERLRRIELVYETVETNLVSGLAELTTPMDQVQN